VDHPRLKRRPLKTLKPLGEPGSKNRHDNAERRLFKDRFAPRRFNRAGYNRKERANYHKRIPQALDARRRRPSDESGPKRKAPDKRLGTRLRRR
jgi:hypothetical protein